jgi:CRP-like cAMP-binding protein
MSFTLTQDVTIISLIVALTALAVAIAILLIEVRRKAVWNVDALALVEEFSQRQRRFEERLIDLKVKFEILELRYSKTRDETYGESKTKDNREGPDVDRVIQRTGDTVTDKIQGRPGPRKDSITLEILRVVSEGGGKTTAREIQNMIGRSREHTARIMNALYKQGLVSRNVAMRPFTYSITAAGRSELGS